MSDKFSTAIYIDRDVRDQIDTYVRNKQFRSFSHFSNEALKMYLELLKRVK